MELNIITSTGKWGNKAAQFNENFSKIDIEIEKLKKSSTTPVGYFGTLDALIEKYPSPQDGDTAWVGTPYPGTIYEYKESTEEWKDTGIVPIVPAVDLDGYATIEDLEELSNAVKAVKDIETIFATDMTDFRTKIDDPTWYLGGSNINGQTSENAGKPLVKDVLIGVNMRATLIVSRAYPGYIAQTIIGAVFLNEDGTINDATMQGLTIVTRKKNANNPWSAWKYVYDANRNIYDLIDEVKVGSGTVDILPFSGFFAATSINTSTSTPPAGGTIVFDTNSKRFVYRAPTGVYYDQFENRDLYNTGYFTRTDRLFVHSNKKYEWNGSDLVLNSNIALPFYGIESTPIVSANEAPSSGVVVYSSNSNRFVFKSNNYYYSLWAESYVYNLPQPNQLYTYNDELYSWNGVILVKKNEMSIPLSFPNLLLKTFGHGNHGKINYALSREFTQNELALNPCLVLMRRKKYRQSNSSESKNRMTATKYKWVEAAGVKNDGAYQDEYLNQSDRMRFIEELKYNLKLTSYTFFRGNGVDLSDSGLTFEEIVGRFCKYEIAYDRYSLMGVSRRKSIEIGIQPYDRHVHAPFGFGIRYDNPAFAAPAEYADKVSEWLNIPKYLYSEVKRVAFSIAIPANLIDLHFGISIK